MPDARTIISLNPLGQELPWLDDSRRRCLIVKTALGYAAQYYMGHALEGEPWRIGCLENGDTIVIECFGLET